MFPSEITNTSFWIRHELPLCAPPPIHGDKILRRQIQSRFINMTDKEIADTVRRERTRLNLKWCLDEYFGTNVVDPFLGQLVTANITGVVHLAYIVKITSTNLTVTPADMFGVSAIVTLEDIYSAECSPFLRIFLRTQRINHPQHILDWWTRHTQRQAHNLSPNINDLALVTMYDDLVFDWPDGDETWMVHDVLPQRNQFFSCTTDTIRDIATPDIVNHTELRQSSDSLYASLTSTISHDRSLDILSPPYERPAEQVQMHLSRVYTDVCLSGSSVIIGDGQPSVDIAPPPTQFLIDRSSSHTIIGQHLLGKSTKLVFDLYPLRFYWTRFSLFHIQLSLFLIYLLLATCSTTVSLYPSTISDIDVVSLNSLIPIILPLLFIPNAISGANSLRFKIFFREVNDLDWFRTLAVP